MNRPLLLISSRPEDHVFAQEIAKATGYPLLAVKTPKEGVNVIAEGNPALTLVDASDERQYGEFETGVQESIGLFSDRISPNSIHFITSKDLDQVPFLVKSPLFAHLITRNYGDPALAGQFYGRIVAATFAPRAFGLHQLLAPNSKIQTVKLEYSSQKQDAVEAVRNFVMQAKFQSRMAGVVANAVDEILMNSIFDAPIDNLGKALYRSTSRATQFKLEGRHAVEMQVGYDGHYVAVTAVDNFGSLDKASLLTHISKVYAQDEYKVKMSVAGAGLGLGSVYRSGGSLFFVSESRVKTEVTVFFKRTPSFREFKDQFRFLSTHFYF